MLNLQKLFFTLFAILIITSCVTTEWKPTVIYHPETESIQSTTPVEGEYIVMLYSTDWCYWCKVAKKWMKKEKIKFLEIPKLIEVICEYHQNELKINPSLSDIIAVDKWSRIKVKEYSERNIKSI